MASTHSEGKQESPDLAQMGAELEDELSANNLTIGDYLNNLTRTLNKTLLRPQDDSGEGQGGGTREEVEVSEGIVWTLVAPLILLGLLLLLGVIAACLWRLKDRRCGRGDTGNEADVSEHGTHRQDETGEMEMQMQEMRVDRLQGAGPGLAFHLQLHPQGRGDVVTRPRYGGKAEGEEKEGRRLAPDCPYPPFHANLHSYPHHHPPKTPRSADTARDAKRKKTKEVHLTDLGNGTPATAAGGERPGLRHGGNEKTTTGLGNLHRPSLEDLARLRLSSGGLVSQDGRVWVSEEELQGGGTAAERPVVEFCSECQPHANTLPRAGGGCGGGGGVVLTPRPDARGSVQIRPCLTINDALQQRVDKETLEKCGLCTPRHNTYPRHHRQPQRSPFDAYHPHPTPTPHLRPLLLPHPTPHPSHLLQERALISQSPDAHLHLGHRRHAQHPPHDPDDRRGYAASEETAYRGHQPHQQRHNHRHHHHRRRFDVSQSVDDHLHLLPGGGGDDRASLRSHPAPRPRPLVPGRTDPQARWSLTPNHHHHHYYHHQRRITSDPDHRARPDDDDDNNNSDSNNPHPTEMHGDDHHHHQPHHHRHHSNRRAIRRYNKDLPQRDDHPATDTADDKARRTGSGRHRDSRRGVENPLFVAGPDDYVDDLGPAGPAGAWDSGRGDAAGGGRGSQGSLERPGGPEDKEGSRERGKHRGRRRSSTGRRGGGGGGGRSEAEVEAQQEEEEEESEGESGTRIINSTSMLSPSDVGDIEHQPDQGHRANPAPLTRKPIVGGPDVSSIKLLNSTSQAWRASLRLLPSTTFSSTEETPSYGSRRSVTRNAGAKNDRSGGSSATTNDQSDGDDDDDDDDEDGEDTLSLPSSISRFHASRVQFPPLMPDAVYPLTSTKAFFSPSTAYHQGIKGQAGVDEDTLENFSDNTSMQPNVGSSVTSGQVSDGKDYSHNASSGAGSDRFLNGSAANDAAAAAAESKARAFGPSSRPQDAGPASASAGNVATSSDEAETAGRRGRRRRERSPGTQAGRAKAKRSAPATHSVAQRFAAATHHENAAYYNDEDDDDDDDGCDDDEGGDSDFTDPYVRALIGSKRSEPSSPQIPRSASEMKRKNWNNLSHQAPRPAASSGKQGFFLIPKRSSGGSGKSGGYIYKYHKAPQVPTSERLEDEMRPGQAVSPTRRQQADDERTRNEICPERERSPTQASAKLSRSGPSPTFSRAPIRRLTTDVGGRRDSKGGMQNEPHPSKLYSCRLPAAQSRSLPLHNVGDPHRRSYQPSPRRSLGPNLIDYTDSTGSQDKTAAPGWKSDNAAMHEAAGRWSGEQAYGRRRRGEEATQDLTPLLLASKTSPHLHHDDLNVDELQPHEPTTTTIAVAATAGGGASSSNSNTSRRNSRELSQRGRRREKYSFVNMGGNFYDDPFWTGRREEGEVSLAETGRLVEGSAQKTEGLARDRPSEPGKGHRSASSAANSSTPAQRRAGRQGMHSSRQNGDGSAVGKEQAPAAFRRLSTCRTDSEILAEVLNSFPQNTPDNQGQNPEAQQQQPLQQPYPGGVHPVHGPQLYSNVTIPTAFADELFGIWSLSPELDDLSSSQPRTPLMTPLKKEAMKANAKFIWGSSGGSPSGSTSNSSLAPGWLEPEDASTHVVVRERAAREGTKTAADSKHEDYVWMGKGNGSNTTTTTTNSATNYESSGSAMASVSDPTSSKEADAEATPPTPTDFLKEGVGFIHRDGGEENNDDDVDDLEHDSNYKALHLDNRSVSHLYVISGDPDHDDLNNNDDFNNNPADLALGRTTTSAPASPVKAVAPAGAANDLDLDPSRASAPPSLVLALDEKQYWL